MVSRGDTVLVELKAALPYFANPFADQIGALRSRLQASGFQVIAINSPAFTDAIVQNHSWYSMTVSVRPVTSDYGQAQDIASIVAGAAQAAGLTVDFNSVTGRVVETVAQSGGPGSVPTYGTIQQTPLSQRGLLDDFSAALGVSKGTLQLAGLALVAVIAISFVRK